MQSQPLTPLMPPPAPVVNTRTAPAPRPVRATGARVFERAGLCAQCSHAATCTDPAGAGAGVRHCDEFDAPAKAAAPVASQVRADPDPPSGALAGLCRNCALAARCTYPRPAGGVWLCDEYC